MRKTLLEFAFCSIFCAFALRLLLHLDGHLISARGQVVYRIGLCLCVPMSLEDHYLKVTQPTASEFGTNRYKRASKNGSLLPTSGLSSDYSTIHFVQHALDASMTDNHSVVTDSQFAELVCISSSPLELAIPPVPNNYYSEYIVLQYRLEFIVRCCSTRSTFRIVRVKVVMTRNRLATT